MIVQGGSDGAGMVDRCHLKGSLVLNAGGGNFRDSSRAAADVTFATARR